VRARGTPAVEHARRGKAGEHTDERDPGRGGDVLAGRIVAHVEPAARDDAGEAEDGGEIEVILPDGVRLKLRGRVEARTLQAVLAALNA